MSNHYLTATETRKPLPLSLPNRFASLCSTFFTSKGGDTKYTGDRVSAAVSLQQMANDMDSLQPSLAAELRAFAARS
jgi:hypothetical protein